METPPGALATIMTRPWLAPLLALLAACDGSAAAPLPAITPAPPALPAPQPSAEVIAPPAPAASSSAGAAASAAPVAPPPAWSPPAVALKELVCEEQGCESLPSFSFSGFPAVSEDGTTFTTAVDVDGWGHVEAPSVVFVDIASGRVETVRLAERSWSNKSAAPFAARVKKVEERLARQRWAAPRPVSTLEGCTRTDANACETAHVAVAGDVRFDFGAGTPRSGTIGWDADTLVVRRGGKQLARTSLDRHRKHCSTHLVSIVHADPARGFAVLTDQIGSTGHDCDGKREPPELSVVRFGK